MKIRVQIENETYEVEVGDLAARPIIAVVDGETFEVYPEDLQQAAPLAAPAARKPVPAAPPPATTANAGCDTPPAPAAQAGERVVTAPIPGVILSYAVKAGDSVETGQELCVLEAMKMKNAIRSRRAGVVLALHAAPGDTVRHGQPLLEFTD